MLVLTVLFQLQTAW